MTGLHRASSRCTLAGDAAESKRPGLDSSPAPRRLLASLCLVDAWPDNLYANLTSRCLRFPSSNHTHRGSNLNWQYGDVSALTLRLLFILSFAALSLGIVALVLAFRWLKWKVSDFSLGRRQTASDAPAPVPDRNMPNDLARPDDGAQMRLLVRPGGHHLRVAEHAGPVDEVRVGCGHHAGVLAQPNASGEPVEARPH